MIFSLFLLVIIRSSACTVTSDNYALEVLLKKPNLIYNQNILVEAKNIKDIDSEYIYKSHYNPNLVVIISKTQPPLL